MRTEGKTRMIAMRTNALASSVMLACRLRADDAPLTTRQTDLQGPVAHTITTAAIIGAGLTWAFSEHGTGARKVSALAFGGAAALGAAAVMTALFPFAGALF